MNLKLTAAAVALFAGLGASTALALGTHTIRTARPVRQNSIPQPNVCNVIYLTDETAPGADLIYSNSAGYPAYNPAQLPSANNGWALYAARKLIYASAGLNTIDMYAPCGTTLSGSLTTAGVAVPLSIAVDYANNVYDTEKGTSTIDWFNSLGVDTPGSYDTPRSPGIPYYLAVDNVGNVYTSGWDPTSSFQTIDVCTPHMTSCAPCETIPPPSWPGGLAIDRFQHLIVNNEDGSIYVYAAGCGAQLSTINYSPTTSSTHFSFTAIALNKRENYLWGAKQFDVSQTGCLSPFCLDAQRLHYAAITGTIGAITPAAHTAILPGQQPGGGIALWPPGPI